MLEQRESKSRGELPGRMVRLGMLLLVALGSVGPALASITLPPVVLKTPGGYRASLELTRALNQSLNRRGIEAQMSWPSRREPAEVATALQQVEEGTRLAKAFRFRGAMPILESAIEDLERNIAWVDDVPALLDAKMTLSTVYVRVGREQDARALVEEVFCQAPYHPVDDEYPSAFKALVAESREDSAKRPSVSIEVMSNTDDDEVFVDGANIGPTPTGALRVCQGRHYLVVRDARGGRWGRTVEPLADEAFYGSTAFSEEAWRDISKEGRPSVTAGASAYEADEVLVAVAEGGQLSLFLERGTGGWVDSVHRAPNPQVWLRSPSLAAAVIALREQADLQVAAAASRGGSLCERDPSKCEEGAQGELRQERRRLVERKWFWPALGVVAAGLGTGTYLLVQDQQGGSGVGVEVTW